MNQSTPRRSVHLVFLAVTLAAYCFGSEDPQLCRGQTIYVSVYSNILTAPRAIQFGLESTLIIRNTDISNPLSVTTADFYDTEGKLVRRFVETPLLLQPLEIKYIHLPSTKPSAGLGGRTSSYDGTLSEKSMHPSSSA